MTAPRPDALAAAISRLVHHPEEAQAMGARARRRVARISWPTVIRTLLAESSSVVATPASSLPTHRSRPRTPGRAKVVVLTSFRVADRAHGGQLRAFHLYGALARSVDVEVVSLVDDDVADSREIAPGLVETAVPRSAAHRRAGDAASIGMATPMTDLVAGSHIHLTPDHQLALRRAARDADAVILAEPYLLPALAVAGVELPYVYDAYNVEIDLKADVYPRTGSGPVALQQVRDLEGAAVRGAAAITACSRDDARRLAALGHRDRGATSVVPNGTDCSALAAPSASARRRAGARWVARARSLDPALAEVEALAVFFGSWHPPNVDAARTIIGIAAELPQVAFVLGGRHSEAVADVERPPNVLLAGMVSDRVKGALLRSAHVALNPMAFGSGTNLKILEYLAAGVPVVSTPVGVRGIDVIDGHHLSVCDHAGLVAAVTDVIRRPDAAAERATAGRSLVESRYDWPALGAALASVVERVVAAPRTR